MFPANETVIRTTIQPMFSQEPMDIGGRTAIFSQEPSEPMFSQEPAEQMSLAGRTAIFSEEPVEQIFPQGSVEQMFPQGSVEQMSLQTPLQSINNEIPETPIMGAPVAPSRTRESYEILQKLGQGGFGSVYKAQIKDTGQIIALKILEITNNKLLEQAKIEIQNLMKISTPTCQQYLACYYGSHYDANRNEMLIEMEYIKGVDLYTWTRNFISQTNSYNRLYVHLLAIMRDLLYGLSYVHSYDLIHRDIKPDNILIDTDNNPKLVDFGLACHSKICPSAVPNLSFTCCYGRAGTPVYMAPETIQTSQSYFSSDIWSLGATFYQAATGNFCFNFKDIKNEKEVLETIAYTFPNILATTNQQLNVAVNLMLNKDPLRRPEILQILNIIRR